MPPASIADSNLVTASCAALVWVADTITADIARSTATITSSGVLVAAAIVGLAAVVFDFVLEPVAIGLGYWKWHAPSIPLQNYIAWGCIAFAAGLAFSLCRIDVRDTRAMDYVAVQFVFFLALRLVPPGTVG